MTLLPRSYRGSTVMSPGCFSSLQEQTILTLSGPFLVYQFFGLGDRCFNPIYLSD